MKCKHNNTMITRGNWGPHKAKEICIDCGKYVKWVKVQQNTYEKRTGSKYQYGSNSRTKKKVADYESDSRSYVHLGI